MNATPSPMPASPASAWTMLLTASRFGASLIFMVYSGAMPALIAAWSMSPAMAGTVQTAFNLGYAISLVATSWMADRFGAKRVFLWSSWLAAGSALVFALFARSPWMAATLFAVQGLAQGGTYAPSIMLVAQGTGPAKRGAAIGGLLAASSFGYFASVALAQWTSVHLGYQFAFLVCAAGPVGAAVVGSIALRDRPNPVMPNPLTKAAGPRLDPRRSIGTRRSALLMIGYTAHCWELLGMWAWMPAFLSVATTGTNGNFTALGIAAVIHLPGTISNLMMGRASDAFGRRRVLVGLALLGTACSFAAGWTQSAPEPLIWTIAAIYGFAAIGDSSVLSTAMTEAVEPARLGTALGLRSILGFGAGGLAPLAFGGVFDATGQWIAAFSLLGIGGAVATAAALLLPKAGAAEEP